MAKLLILDLDETLIHASKVPLTRAHDFVAGPYFVYKRPYLEEFIDFCFRFFKVAVWTSSSQLYAQTIAETLFSQGYSLEFLFARDRCVRRFDPELQSFFYIKDLSKVKKKGYTLEQIIMLDDTPQKLSRHYGNLVRVKEWLGDESDDELKIIQPFLLELNKQSNIRQLEKRNWRDLVSRL